MRKPSLVLSLLLLPLLAALVAGPAQGATIPAGTDYFATQPGSFINLGSGDIPLMGVPLGNGLGNTDTIIQRTTDITIGASPSGPALLLTALQLKSIAPVTLNAFNGTIFISLDPGNLANDIGLIAISQTSPSGGVFDSLLDVFFDVCTAPGVDGVGCGSGTLLGAASIQLGPNIGNPWSTTDPSAIVPDAGFFPGANGPVTDEGPLPFVDVLAAAQIPEPGSLVLFGGALLALVSLRRRSRAASE